MSLAALTEQIEAEVEIRLGVISGFSHFAATVAELDEARALQRLLSRSWRARAQLRARVAEMVLEAASITDVAYAKDNSLALYLLVLAEVGTSGLHEALASSNACASLLWGRRAAHAVLSRIEQRGAECLRANLVEDAACQQERLDLQVRGHAVWRRSDRWDDLLAHLAANWPKLTWEEGYPVALDVRDPTEYEIKVRDYLEQLPHLASKAVHQRLEDFQASHDLSSFQSDLPSVWVVHQGRQSWLATPHEAHLCSRADVIACLRTLGDQLAARLAVAPGERQRQILEAWEAAGATTPAQLVALATGLSEEESQALDLLEFSEDEPEPTELMAAARMIVSADYRHVLTEVIARLRDVPASRSQELDRLSEVFEAAKPDAFAGAKPHEQGYEAANWLRAQLGCADDPIDPSVLLDDWSVERIDCELEEPSIEAIAVWGPRHGPAILINQAARYSSAHRLNMTLAHEIAHLLLDRRRALPLAEVLGGSVPKLVEQRARAFAAEFLLPRRIAGAAFMQTSDPSTTIGQLSKRYAVGHEVIAWQARNANQALPAESEQFLKTKVSRPQLYERDW